MQPVATLQALFYKPAQGAWVEPTDQLVLKRGCGIVGDANAQVGSPRQVLFAGTPSLQAFGLQPGDLQENLLLDVAVESLESGTVLQLGATARVRLMFLCEPCASLERLKPGLSCKIHGKRGMLGLVVADGTVRLGDPVWMVGDRFPVIPETTRGKFAEFVARIPPGKVVPTKNLLLALGLTTSYARTIPTMLKKSDPTLPVHRIVAADGRLFTQHLPDQRAVLLAEGVAIAGDRVNAAHFWEAESFHLLDP
ncbi:MGMT family protein [Vacuolonema iberomarrocanum]|uniref:MGMT family protein n=1 Tax=Vacuolonema iberomarrocanum TaxID=3454632 RepID=UPI0019E5DF26|nr:MGMT family protein [filamentous cyanobacterium LEGE 07170]